MRTQLPRTLRKLWLTPGRRACAAGILCIVAVLRAYPAAQRQNDENSIKAAFLYNFTKFIDWPESAFPGSGAHFTMCVFANDGFRRELEAIMLGEQVRGRLVAIAVPDAADDLKSCHLVYFGPDENDRAAKRLPTVRQVPILTVGEGRRFLEQGGQIAFMLENDRVRFDISKSAANAAGLNISSKLLRVARQIYGATP
jgi:hypothetical protein